MVLIIANGPFRSGSTWLYNILAELTAFPGPPRRYWIPHWTLPCLSESRLDEFLGEWNRTDDYLVKNHFCARTVEKVLSQAGNDVRVFHIVRDFRDVVVSAYHFYQRLGRGYPGFQAFYWTEGRRIHRILKDHHERMCSLQQIWSQICTVSYDRLLCDFAGEILKIGAALGTSLGPADVARVRQATTFTALREKYDERSMVLGKEFFRKGVVGDYLNYYDRLMLKDFSEIERGNRSWPCRLLAFWFTVSENRRTQGWRGVGKVLRDLAACRLPGFRKTSEPTS